MEGRKKALDDRTAHLDRIRGDLRHFLEHPLAVISSDTRNHSYPLTSPTCFP
jgi:hypothetical protein